MGSEDVEVLLCGEVISCGIEFRKSRMGCKLGFMGSELEEGASVEVGGLFTATSISRKALTLGPVFSLTFFPN